VDFRQGESLVQNAGILWWFIPAFPERGMVSTIASFPERGMVSTIASIPVKGIIHYSIRSFLNRQALIETFFYSIKADLTAPSLIAPIGKSLESNLKRTMSIFFESHSLPRPLNITPWGLASRGKFSSECRNKPVGTIPAFPFRGMALILLISDNHIPLVYGVSTFWTLNNRAIGTIYGTNSSSLFNGPTVKGSPDWHDTLSFYHFNLAIFALHLSPRPLNITPWIEPARK
jgi:hypothetical protein